MFLSCIKFFFYLFYIIEKQSKYMVLDIKKIKDDAFSEAIEELKKEYCDDLDKLKKINDISERGSSK